MLFGELIRELCVPQRLAWRQVTPLLSVGVSYLSRVDTGKQTYGEYPIEALIRRLASALDDDELLLLAEKIPQRTRRRLVEQPGAFRELAQVDDDTLRRVLAIIH